eukprot:jgi/Ulvmu1/5980/UM026_0104.1
MRRSRSNSRHASFRAVPAVSDFAEVSGQHAAQHAQHERAPFQAPVPTFGRGSTGSHDDLITSFHGHGAPPLPVPPPRRSASRASLKSMGLEAAPPPDAAAVDDRSAVQAVCCGCSAALCGAGSFFANHRLLAMLGVLLLAACSVAVTLSVLAYTSLQATPADDTPADFTADAAWPGGPTIGELLADPDTGTLIAGDAAAGRARDGSLRVVDVRIAFGSGYVATGAEHRVWRDAVLPLEPDAWLWTGNAAYFDSSVLNCSAAANAGRAECACARADAYAPLAAPAPLCGGVTAQHAAKRAGEVAAGGYDVMLDYACQSYFTRHDAVPLGALPGVCPRPVLGIYGVHDSFGVMEDKSFAEREAVKQVYLDMLGESANSARRMAGRGAHSRQRLYEDASGHVIDAFFLDEHFHRAPLPCQHVATACALPQHAHTRLCQAYAADPATVPCCAADADAALAWCQATASLSHPAYTAICRPWTADFAANATSLVDGAPATPDPADWRTLYGDGGGGVFCDVLGARQRTWLARALAASDARLNIVVAPGGLLGSPGADGSGGCTGTEWDCYRPAQVNLLHTLANASACTIVLSGDNSHSDIKVVRPGDVLPYAAPYQTPHLAKSVYQVNTAGLSALAAPGIDTRCGAPCCGDTLDSSMLRVGGACAVHGGPSFGVMDVDWMARLARLRVMRGDGGGTANVDDPLQPATLDFTIDLQLCMDG